MRTSNSPDALYSSGLVHYLMNDTIRFRSVDPVIRTVLTSLPSDVPVTAPCPPPPIAQQHSVGHKAPPFFPAPARTHNNINVSSTHASRT